ncbi:biotin transporter BioY [Dolosigranulum pigrum]|jgi:protein bioY|uniref:biotin transporter BioY n=1 Tax=Dolosigranulum pigrum TaxID=29394 RepID=UPI000DC5D1D4|nr:biotin transporter BioY [Dolosigranulum pigrum]QTJ52492.1 hypothetical protein FE332_08800 [Dolosigranulum pigrum]RAN52871.1 hypothetical protein B8A31_03625 [Dolosigranulum pigrum]
MRTLTTKDLVYIAVLTAMLCVASLVAIPVGIGIPITLQVFFWLLIPALLKAYRGFLSLALYVLIGLIGIPVFAGGTGGFQAVLSPSFGFLLGSLIIALYIGKVAQKRPSLLTMILHMIVAILILYTIGILYQYFIFNVIAESGGSTTLISLIIANVSSFLPLDILKAILAGIVYDRLIRHTRFKNI